MRRVGLFQSKVVLMGYRSDLDAHMMGMITEKKEGCNEIKNASSMLAGYETVICILKSVLIYEGKKPNTGLPI